MLKSYTGTCNACGKQSEYLEQDHRVPVRLGGDQHRTNMQMLCLECHKRKTFLETSLFSFYCTTDTVREWFRLAFQDDKERIKLFIDQLALRVSHFGEVAART